MENKTITNLNIEFKRYTNTYKECESDICFLNSCITEHVKTLAQTLGNQDYYFDSGKYTYNTGPDSDSSLRRYRHGDHTITPQNIDSWQADLLSNINIIHIVKIYNAIERILIYAIRDNYFVEVDDKLSKLQKSIDYRIRNEGHKDKTNNKHLIDFLKLKSDKCRLFLEEKIRIDLTITWDKFFQLLSTLRNNIAHNGGMIDSEGINNLKGLDKNFINLFFAIQNGKLEIKDNMQFANAFFDICNEFAVNLTKFIYDENDLEFLGFE